MIVDIIRIEMCYSIPFYSINIFKPSQNSKITQVKIFFHSTILCNSSNLLPEENRLLKTVCKAAKSLASVCFSEKFYHTKMTNPSNNNIWITLVVIKVVRDFHKFWSIKISLIKKFWFDLWKKWILTKMIIR